MTNPDRNADSAPDSAKVKRAVSRLEEAVNDLIASAGESAAEYIERAAERVRSQVSGHDAGDDDRAGGRQSYRPRPRREPAWLWSEEPRSTKLYRDKRRGKLLGVCAGFGRYYGVEAWVVRCVAITGVIFLNWVVIVAYFAAGIILDVEPDDAARRPRPGAGHGQAGQAEADGRHGVDGSDNKRPSRPAAALSPQAQLRLVDADFDEIELRLRRMETHVTSGRYELHREFGRIDGAAKPSANLS